jgi:ATP-binding cassette, subfamily B, bacterial MsbA
LRQALRRFRDQIWSQDCAKVLEFSKRDLLVPSSLTVGIALLDAASLLLLVPLLSSLSGGEPPVFLKSRIPNLNPQQYFLSLVVLLLLTGLTKASLSYALHNFDGRLYHRWSTRLSQYFFGCYLDYGKAFFQAESQSQIWEILEKRFSLLTLFLGLQRLVLNSALLLTHLLILLFISLPLTVALTLMIPLVHFILQWEMRRNSRRSAELSKVAGKLYPEAYKVFATLDLYRSYCQEGAALDRLNSIGRNIEDVSVANWKFQGSVERLREILSLLCLSALLLFTSQVVMEQPSEILVYLIFFFVVKNSLPLIGSYQQIALEFADLLPEAEGFCATFERGKTFQIPQGEREFHGLSKGIEIRQLTFTYGSGTTALRKLDLTIGAGKTTAIVGESGAGKSTLTELLLCNYEVPEESLFLDGIDIREFTHRSLRRQIAIIGQEALLFRGTLRENLRFGCSETVTDERLRDVLGKTRLLTWVDSLPDGLETMVSDRGLTLSAGQRQRVSICRALLREASIYLIDEATSHLDQKTKAEISKVLQEATRGRTVVLIAHQLETVVHSHKIVVLEEGCVVEEGSFEELLRADRQFAQHWEARTTIK